MGEFSAADPVNQSDKLPSNFLLPSVDMVTPSISLAALTSFCMPPMDKDYGALHRPFVQAGYVFATDSAVAVCIDDGGHLSDPDRGGLAAPLSLQFEQIWSTPPTEFQQWPAAALVDVPGVSAQLHLLDSRYVSVQQHQKVARLPGVEFAPQPGPPGSNLQPVLFQFAGGRGLLMPFRAG